jgi:hypothetical protein
MPKTADHPSGLFHDCRCTCRSPPSPPHARDLHTQEYSVDAAAPAARDLHGLCCRTPVSSSSTPSLPLPHETSTAAVAARWRPPAPRCRRCCRTHEISTAAVVASMRPSPPRRRRNSRLLWTNSDPLCGNDQVRYCPSFTFKTMSASLLHHQGIQMKTEKMSSLLKNQKKCTKPFS